MKMNTTKRLVAFLLTVVMLLGLLPVTALAEDENTNQVYVTVENTTISRQRWRGLGRDACRSLGGYRR